MAAYAAVATRSTAKIIINFMMYDLAASLYIFIGRPDCMHMLFFAPMNLVGNCLYRHFLLKRGADYVFSELIRMDRVREEFTKEKHRIISGDEDRTIMQIGAATEEEIDQGVKLFPHSEINLNMCCPHSTLVQNNRCGGILKQPALMRRLCMHLARSRDNASVKIRLGPSMDDIRVDEYLRIIQDSGLRKVFIHARTLRHPYHKPAFYAPLQDIQRRFPGLHIVINGDIDSYDAAMQAMEYTGCKDIMIGRAALMNPDVFRQIRDQIPAKTERYDPLRNDISQDRLARVRELICLAGPDTRIEPLKANIIYLLKGSGYDTTAIYGAKTLKSLREHINHTDAL